LALLTAKEKKMGIMVRKGFITPQNKQHEKQYRFKIVSSLFYIILFRARIKAQKIDSDSLLSVIIKDMKNGKTTSKIFRED
jgi:hypothetical protein